MLVRPTDRKTLLLGIACLTGCRDSPTEPPATPGLLNIHLTAPSSPAALLLIVRGPAFAGGATGGPATVVHSRATADGLRAAVFGELANGAILRFHVPDTRTVKEYSAEVVQVAGNANELKESMQDYRLSIAP